MDLIQLRMFCTVAHCGSIIGAAKQLYRVPSNLTTRIKQLEQELGVSLFIREKQRLSLSVPGRHFLSYANRILALSDEAINQFHQKEPCGQLSLGTMDSLAATRLPDILAAYHQLYPTVDLTLEIGTSGKIIRKLLNGQLAMALVDAPEEYEQCDSCVAFRDQLVLISSLSLADPLRPEHLSNLTFYTFDRSCSYRQRLELWLKTLSPVPIKFMELHSYHAMIACVAGGGGGAVIPLSLLEQITSPTQVKTHLLPEPYREITIKLLWRKDSPLPSIKAMASLVTELYPQHNAHPLPWSLQSDKSSDTWNNGF